MIKLSNLAMTKEIIFDNENYAIHSKDLGASTINLSTFQGYNQIGVNVAGRVIGQRDISITGFILAENENDMLDKKRLLQQIASPLEDFYLMIGDYKIQVSATSSIKYSSTYAQNNPFIAMFILNGSCANPCFTKIYTSTIPVAYWGGGFHFPLNIPVVMGCRQSSQIKMIENTGEIDVGMKITFTAKADGVVNPRMYNMLTGETLQMNCELNEGDKVVIDTGFGKKSVVFNDEIDYLYKMDLDSDFLQLHAGENYFYYECEGTVNNLELEIQFTPEYLEV